MVAAAAAVAAVLDSAVAVVDNVAAASDIVVVVVAAAAVVVVSVLFPSATVWPVRDLLAPNVAYLAALHSDRFLRLLPTALIKQEQL